MAADVLGRDFTMVHNAALRDRRLTRRARGLLVEVLSRRAGFGISEASLVAAGPEGRDAVRKALRELEEHGYLHREQARAGGRFGETVFRLTDMPEGLTVRAGSPWTDSQSTEQNPRSGPLTEKPSTEKPTTENPQHKKTKFQNTNLSPAPDVPTAPSADAESVTDEREESAGRNGAPTPTPAAAADIPPESVTDALCAAWASGAGIPRTPATIARQIGAQALDLAAAAGRELPTGVVLDGEAVAAGPDGRVTFAAMQRRGLASPRNAARLARTTAVAYAAFDLLELRGTDTRPRPYRDRRAALLELLPAGRTAAVLQAVPATEDLDVAAGWWAAWETAPGVEGIIAKRTRGPYRPGKRDWVKVKYPNSRGG